MVLIEDISSVSVATEYYPATLTPHPEQLKTEAPPRLLLMRPHLLQVFEVYASDTSSTITPPYSPSLERNRR
jgi:hypothetical protein